jgi:hypothetical protein
VYLLFQLIGISPAAIPKGKPPNRLSGDVLRQRKPARLDSILHSLPLQAFPITDANPTTVGQIGRARGIGRATYY